MIVLAYREVGNNVHVHVSIGVGTRVRHTGILVMNRVQWDAFRETLVHSVLDTVVEVIRLNSPLDS